MQLIQCVHDGHNVSTLPVYNSLTVFIVGAFYPYSRNHNGINWRDQHPPALGELSTESARRTLTIRYKLLPTLYTLMYESHAFGTTTVRSLMAEFQSDRNARDNYDQFLWGGGFMIAPILEENKESRGVYFPRGRWYDYHSGQIIVDHDTKESWAQLE